MSKKILIIDDDPVGVALFESRLTKAGFEVLTANTGGTGISMTKAHKPDVVILDVEMPDMNGYSVVTEIRMDPEIKSTRVIVVTGHEENKPIFARKGVKDYLIKPANVDQLIELLNADE